MTTQEKTELLNLLDWERQTIYPGPSSVSETRVIKDFSDDRKSCEIVYSFCEEGEVDAVIKHQIEIARIEQYELEWKVYSHDKPHCLGERLLAAGFEPEDREAFMVCIANHEALDRFGPVEIDIRRITDREGLRDYQTIHEEVTGQDTARTIERYAQILENRPGEMSVYVAYVDGEPAACARAYFVGRSKFAGLYGGQTRVQFRKHGIYKQLVAVRIREALERGIVNICVDALPTSEPILRKRGFEIVTYTQPFCLPV